MKSFRNFFSNTMPNEEELGFTRRIIIVESAVAAIIYSIGTSNFLTGYLTQLGASISLCALVTMIPQIGCVLQIFSPFLFERLKQRKFSIWILCLIFRLSVSLCFLAPLLVTKQSLQLVTVITLYLVGFFSAGFVTPGLTNMVIDIAPKKGRGKFFAWKNIVAACICSLAMPILGKTVDYYISVGMALRGYFLIGVVCLGLTVIDSVLLVNVQEPPVTITANIGIKDLLLPISDAHYRPVLLYSVVGGLTSGIAAPFLVIYQLYVLNLSHTFITSAGVLASIAGMIGTWLWGKYSDHSTWAKILMLTASISLGCTLGWAFIPMKVAHLLAPILMIISSACAGGSGIASMNLQYESSPQSRKTAYIGVTSGLSGIASSLSAAVGASLQSMLQPKIGNYSISILFIIAGVCGIFNLIINGRRLKTYD